MTMVSFCQGKRNLGSRNGNRFPSSRPPAPPTLPPPPPPPSSVLSFETAEKFLSRKGRFVVYFGVIDLAARDDSLRRKARDSRFLLCVLRFVSRLFHLVGTSALLSTNHVPLLPVVFLSLSRSTNGDWSFHRQIVRAALLVGTGQRSYYNAK